MNYRTIIKDSGDPGYVNRVLVGTASTGLLRVEWVQARYGQIIPVNWSQVTYMQYMDSYMPLRYQVDDAQNLIVKAALDGDFGWLLFIEHDNVIPEDAFIRFNHYIKSGEYPVVSGLYYTRSIPSEPLVFRGDGTSNYTGWQFGDKVMVDRVPTGVLLIHCGLLRAMADEAEEYQLYGQTVKRVFETPRHMWFDPESNNFNTISGTSDIKWSKDVIEGGFLEKAGFPEFQKREYPFLVDTEIFCGHVETNGVMYPPMYQEIRKGIAKKRAEQPPTLGVNTAEFVGIEEVLNG